MGQNAKGVLSRTNDPRKNQEGCDVVLIVSSKIFPAHKSVLSEFSDYFKAMFSGGFMESTQSSVKLDGIDAETFEIILNYMYLDSIKITRSNVGALMHASNYIQASSIVDACSQFLLDGLDAKNCVDTLDLARMYSCENLIETVCDVIAKNISFVVKLQSFQQLDVEALAVILSHTSVFNALTQWMLENRNDVKVAFHEILAKAGLSDIDSKILHNRSHSADGIQRSKKYAELINLALWKSVFSKERQQSNKYRCPTEINLRQKHWVLEMLKRPHVAQWTFHNRVPLCGYV